MVIVVITAHLSAHDTCLLVGAPTINQLETQLNLELTEIFNWMVANKLT